LNPPVKTFVSFDTGWTLHEKGTKKTKMGEMMATGCLRWRPYSFLSSNHFDFGFGMSHIQLMMRIQGYELTFEIKKRPYLV
jgi:hypothetical protein